MSIIIWFTCKADREERETGKRKHSDLMHIRGTEERKEEQSLKVTEAGFDWKVTDLNPWTAQENLARESR